MAGQERLKNESAERLKEETEARARASVQAIVVERRDFY